MTVARRRVVARRDGPEHRLLDLAVVADPLRLHASGHEVVRDAGGDLHAGVAAQERLHEAPRRGPVVDVEAAPSRRPARRIGEGHVEGGGVDHGRVRDGHRTAEAQRLEVGHGHCDPHRVEVDAGTGDPGAGVGEQVAADAAPEVDQGRGVRRPQPRCPVGRDRQAGGLLEAFGREVHPLRQVAELLRRPLPQLHLGDRGGDPLRAGSAPQGGLRRQGVGARVRRRGQQPLPLVGEQPAEGVEVHPAILAPVLTRSGTHWVRVLVFPLALSR